MKRPTHLLGRFLEALIGGLVAGIVLLLLVPVAIGWRPYTVLTGSMRPGVQPGDVVMARPIAVPAIHVGDVVTFSDPTRDGKLVTHRVRAIIPRGLRTEFETRGDANSASEKWVVATDQRVGRVVYVVPKVGYVAKLIRNPVGLIVLVVLPVLGLGIGALRKIWRKDDDDESDPAEAAPPPQPEPTGSLPADQRP